MSEYDPQALQAKWQQRWEELDPFRASEDAADTRERRYVCDMFPYPSGDLHMGHGEVFAIADVVSRYWFQQGYNVLHPIGWDSFGLPAENAAIKRNAHPAEWTYANIETQATSFKRYGVSFDWSRRLHTSDPDYYRWNQWLFNRFFERGLAYRKGGLVNWCPNDQTVLANEQVVAGKCERCGADVIRRELTQWYFKITDYAQRLLDDMDQLEGGWPERVMTMQRNWIGRSEGADVLFEIEGRDEPVHVYTTRPDTLFGATFFVVAVDAALAEEIVTDEQRPPSRPTAPRSPSSATSSGCPPTRTSPASSWAATRSTRSTASASRSGPPTTSCPTTATAPSWPSPRTTSATWTSPSSSSCR